ncbi:MAG: hypothetical protein AAFQ17_00380, partial [Pseudomonadota bacterium]
IDCGLKQVLLIVGEDLPQWLGLKQLPKPPGAMLMLIDWDFNVLKKDVSTFIITERLCTAAQLRLTASRECDIADWNECEGKK